MRRVMVRVRSVHRVMYIRSSVVNLATRARGCTLARLPVTPAYRRRAFVEHTRKSNVTEVYVRMYVDACVGGWVGGWVHTCVCAASFARDFEIRAHTGRASERRFLENSISQ